MFRNFSFNKILMLFLVTGALVVMIRLPVWAQTGTPPELPVGKENPEQPGHRPQHPNAEKAPNGDWFVPGEPENDFAPETPAGGGGPDEYGYTWADGTYGWVNAAGGTNTGMSGFGDSFGPVTLPFDFKFYEHTYDELWISSYGYLAFNDDGLYNSQDDIPSPWVPNDVIAPLWTPSYIGPNSWVKYLTAGTAPNRYFVIEWFQIAGGDPSDPIFGDDIYTFEVILFENGDIKFQYQTMDVNGGRWCSSSGIEDSTGMDGLTYVDLCAVLPSEGAAVRFYRPPPSARVKLNTTELGSFSTAGASQGHVLTVTNSGDLGSDTYDLTSSSNWPLSFRDAFGNLLTDTDSDGKVDTGPIAQGASRIIQAVIKVPSVVNVGDDDTANVTFTSSINAGVGKTATIRTAIPAPFAQAFVDYSDGAMSLLLARPEQQVTAHATGDYFYAYNSALAETPGFIYVWTQYDCDSDNCWGNIEYTLLDEQGNVIKPITKLTNNNSAANYVYDYPAVAVAPNGNIGVVWYRYRWNPSAETYNLNIHYRILNPAGNPITAAIDLTQNGVWGDNSPQYYHPLVVATDDNHLALSWEAYEPLFGISDIYTAFLDSQGNVIQGPVNRTSNVGNEDSFDHNLTPMNSNKVLLAYDLDDNYNVRYQVLNSNGGTVVGETNIPASANDWHLGAARLSSGRIIIAWTDFDYPSPQGRFVILSADGLNILAGPTTLDAVNDAGYEYGMSAVADEGGNAILSWGDSVLGDKQIYALVDDEGNILTPPTIFLRSETDLSGNLYVNHESTDLASFTQNPTFAGVDNRIDGPDWAGSSPDGFAAIPIEFGNYGAADSTGVKIIMTLPAGLGYISDSSGITPSVNGNTFTWNLPSLGFLGYGNFTILVSTPADPIGTAYSLDLEIESLQADGNPADNSIGVEVRISHQIFLPAIKR